MGDARPYRATVINIDCKESTETHGFAAWPAKQSPISINNLSPAITLSMERGAWSFCKKNLCAWIQFALSMQSCHCESVADRARDCNHQFPPCLPDRWSVFMPVFFFVITSASEVDSRCFLVQPAKDQGVQ
jgi:hypothetical protein